MWAENNQNIQSLAESHERFANGDRLKMGGSVRAPFRTDACACVRAVWSRPATNLRFRAGTLIPQARWTSTCVTTHSVARFNVSYENQAHALGRSYNVIECCSQHGHARSIWRLVAQEKDASRRDGSCVRCTLWSRRDPAYRCACDGAVPLTHKRRLHLPARAQRGGLPARDRKRG